MLGWVIATGIVFTVVALRFFWQDVASWLNNTAANAVEKVLGYNARKYMQKAISRVTRVINTLNNISTVFTKKHSTDNFLHKVTLRATAPAYEQSEDVLNELEKNKELINTFTYTGN